MRAFSMIFVAGVALAGLFFLLKPVSTLPPPGAAPQQQVATTTAPAERPEAGQPAEPATTPAYETITAAEIEDTAEPDVIGIEIADRRIVSGPDTVRVAKGDTVRIMFSADAQSELHLHGYDITVDIPPAVPTELQFVADKTGRFEYELHGHHHSEGGGGHAALGVIEVYP